MTILLASVLEFFGIYQSSHSDRDNHQVPVFIHH